MEWVLVGLGVFLILLLMLLKPSSNDFGEDVEQLHGYGSAPPTTTPTSNSFDDQCRRGRRLAHMGAPSPGARQPEWLRLAHKETAQRQRKRVAGWASGIDPGWSAADRLADEQQAAMADAAAEAAAEATAEIAAAERERMLLVDEMADDEAYPYDADWDDHDVDWGETR